MDKHDRIKQVKNIARNDHEAIVMLLSSCADIGSERGVLLSIAKFDDAAEIILEYLSNRHLTNAMYSMDLNYEELNKEWEESFYESGWKPDTLKYTETENSIIKELKTFLPRHMQEYDWNLPYAEVILLIFRRHLKGHIGTLDSTTKSRGESA